jgi:membrane protein implicated in regulation of membrane protease activity
MAWWFWILLGLVFLGLELALPGGFFLVFFGFSALLIGALVAVVAPLPVWVEWVCFSVLSILLLAGLRKKLIELLGPNSVDTVDSLLGKEVVVSEQIAAGSRGGVQLHGASWQAENIGDVPLTAGSYAKVQALDGLALKIK